MDRLGAHLQHQARYAARSVLANYTTEEPYDRLRCAIEAGAAAEWLVRALLANANPALLAEPRRHDSLLALAGVRPLPDSDLRHLKTVTLTEALDIALKIDPTSSIRADVDFIKDVRNGAAHAGVVAPSSMQETARRLVRVVAAVSPQLGVDHAEFWGALLAPVAEGILADFEDEIAARVASKIAAARSRVNNLTWNLPKAQADLLLAALEVRAVPHLISSPESEDHEYSCPACGRRAWLSYLRLPEDTDRYLVDSDRAGEPIEPYFVVPVTLVPSLLQCPVCELVLDETDDELSGLEGIEEVPESEPIIRDVDEYYESDYDRF